MLVILLLHFLAFLKTPLRDTDHEAATSVSRIPPGVGNTHLSNINAILPSPTLFGFSSALLAPSNASASGPCALMTLCKLAPAGWNPPPVFAS